MRQQSSFGIPSKNDNVALDVTDVYLAKFQSNLKCTKLGWANNSGSWYRISYDKAVGKYMKSLIS